MMKIGYIVVYDQKMNPGHDKYVLREAHFTRRISQKGDKAYSKLLCFPVDYDEIVDNARLMKENPQIIIVKEPFLLDDELREKVTKWIARANKAHPSEYDPFYREEKK